MGKVVNAFGTIPVFIPTVESVASTPKKDDLGETKINDIPQSVLSTTIFT